MTICTTIIETEEVELELWMPTTSRSGVADTNFRDHAQRDADGLPDDVSDTQSVESIETDLSDDQYEDAQAYIDDDAPTSDQDLSFLRRLVDGWNGLNLCHKLGSVTLVATAIAGIALAYTQYKQQVLSNQLAALQTCVTLEEASNTIANSSFCRNVLQQGVRNSDVHILKRTLFGVRSASHSTALSWTLSCLMLISISTALFVIQIVPNHGLHYTESNNVDVPLHTDSFVPPIHVPNDIARQFSNEFDNLDDGDSEWYEDALQDNQVAEDLYTLNDFCATSDTEDLTSDDHEDGSNLLKVLKLLPVKPQPLDKVNEVTDTQTKSRRKLQPADNRAAGRHLASFNCTYANSFTTDVYDQIESTLQAIIPGNAQAPQQAEILIEKLQVQYQRDIMLTNQERLRRREVAGERAFLISFGDKGGGHIEAASVSVQAENEAIKRHKAANAKIYAIALHLQPVNLDAKKRTPEEIETIVGELQERLIAKGHTSAFRKPVTDMLRAKLVADGETEAVTTTSAQKVINTTPTTRVISPPQDTNSKSLLHKRISAHSSITYGEQRYCPPLTPKRHRGWKRGM